MRSVCGLPRESRKSLAGWLGLPTKAPPLSKWGACTMPPLQKGKMSVVCSTHTIYCHNRPAFHFSLNTESPSDQLPSKPHPQPLGYTVYHPKFEITSKLEPLRQQFGHLQVIPLNLLPSPHSFWPQTWSVTSAVKLSPKIPQFLNPYAYLELGSVKLAGQLQVGAPQERVRGSGDGVQVKILGHLISHTCTYEPTKQTISKERG